MEVGEEGGSVTPPAAAAAPCRREGPSRPAPCPTLDPGGATAGSWARARGNRAPPSGAVVGESGGEREGWGGGASGGEGACRAPGGEGRRPEGERMVEDGGLEGYERIRVLSSFGLTVKGYN